MKPHSASRHQGVRFDIAALLLALGLACGAPAVRAQADAGEPDALLRDEPDLAVAKLAPGLVTLTHEAVPALQWPPMTMPFPLATPDLARGLKPGDKVRFTLRVQGDENLVTAIEKAKP